MFGLACDLPFLQTRCSRSSADAARARVAGFTQVELLVVVAVSGVLASLAVPSMNEMLALQRTTSLVNNFVASLHLARGEGIMRSARAAVCKSADGRVCTADGGWEQGWIVFHDANNNALLDPGERVVRQQGAVSGVRLRGNASVARYVSYGATGRAKLTSGAFQAGTFTLCPESTSASGSGAAVRQIVLSPTGRPRVLKATLAACE